MVTAFHILVALDDMQMQKPEIKHIPHAHHTDSNQPPPSTSNTAAAAAAAAAGGFFRVICTVLGTSSRELQAPSTTPVLSD